MDLAGHEKYFKTTAYGEEASSCLQAAQQRHLLREAQQRPQQPRSHRCSLPDGTATASNPPQQTTRAGLTGHLPDYACLIVGANAGVVGMCKEHLGMALALKVPTIFVVTKVGMGGCVEGLGGWAGGQTGGWVNSAGRCCRWSRWVQVQVPA